VEAAETRREERAWTFNYGAVPLMLLLPPLVYWMWICMVDHGGAMTVPSWDMVRRIPLPTPTSIAMFVGWFVFQALLQIYAPGPWTKGTPLADGSRLSYKMNGWFSWWATWFVLGVGCALGFIPTTILYDQLGPLMSTVNVFTFGFAVYLYVLGKKQPDDGAGVLTGNVPYDYFIGTSLNPRVKSFDWKLFCEARPGLIAWVVINLSLAAKQYELHGRVSTPMILVCLFHFWYIADYYFHEEAILTTWDIKHENFGWMLCWGDLVWVPFTYTLQALYLVQHPFELPVAGVVGIVALQTAGYVIFRGTNIQKHRFRNDPKRLIWGKKPEFIQTSRGTPLLVSGFWGIARHLNYLGDLMMGLAWCLVCGFSNVLPYFYIIYFTILLVHRERRDHVTCAKKYGDDWVAYCKRVRWRIVPGVY
jgi:protein-S-isoprenylcysteine O-methyltransferase Ste14